MQFIDYNFVSDDVAKNIMESYGYEVPANEQESEVVSEDVAAPELPDYVCVVNEKTGEMFIAINEVKVEE